MNRKKIFKYIGLIFICLILLPIAPLIVGGIFVYKLTKSSLSKRNKWIYSVLIVIAAFLLTDRVINALPKTTTTPTPTPVPTANVQVSSQEKIASPTPTSTSNPNFSVAKVIYVVDGDTFKIDTDETIRMIGVDTPETVHPSKPTQCFGREASAKTKEILDGREVRLEKDVLEKDKYGRLLRYVYVGDIFVNEYLAREGYAYAVSYPPDVKYQDIFKRAQESAMSENKGLWNPSICPAATPIPTIAGAFFPTTAPAITTQEPSGGSCKYSCSGPDKDCSDFSTHTEAQSFFDCCGFSAGNDPMRLDKANGTGNGLACESLP